MKKINTKSIMLGIVIGTLFAGSVQASQLKIKSAEFNNTKVIFNGTELNLSKNMITVINDGSQYGSNYMPVRDVLEAMDFNVDWDAKQNAVIINDIVDVVEKEDDELDVPLEEIENIASQEDIDKFKNLFNILDLEYIETPKCYTQKFIYKEFITKDEFNTLIESYINRDIIMECIMKTIKTDEPFPVYIIFYLDDGESMYRMCHYIKYFNGKITNNIRLAN